MFVPEGATLPLRLALFRRATLQPTAARLGPGASFHQGGRSALSAGLRLLQQSGLRRVWLPAYLCRSVQAAVEACGLDVAIYDVDEQLRPARLVDRFGDREGLLLVHFFGLAHTVPVARDLVGRGMRLLIEDCAHALPRGLTDSAFGESGAVAIFSLRKQLPVPDGGVLLVKPEFGGGVTPAVPAQVSVKKLLIMAAERLGFLTGVNPLPWKDRLRARFGSTDGHFDIDAVAAPRGPSRLTARIVGATDWAARVARKRRNYERLATALSTVARVAMPFPQLPPGSVPSVMPVFVDDARRMSERLRSCGIGAGRWPAEEGLAGLDWTSFPGARKWMERSLLLPVHEDLTGRHLDRMVDTVRSIAQRG